MPQRTRRGPELILIDSRLVGWTSHSQSANRLDALMPGSLVRTPPVPVPVAGNGSLFEQHPIRLAGFQLRARSAAAVGTPKFEH